MATVLPHTHTYASTVAYTSHPDYFFGHVEDIFLFLTSTTTSIHGKGTGPKHITPEGTARRKKNMIYTPSPTASDPATAQSTPQSPKREERDQKRDVRRSQNDLLSVRKNETKYAQKISVSRL